MLSEVVINEEKMKSVTENGYIIALDLAENFVLEKIPATRDVVVVFP